MWQPRPIGLPFATCQDDNMAQDLSKNDFCRRRKVIKSMTASSFLSSSGKVRTQSSAYSCAASRLMPEESSSSTSRRRSATLARAFCSYGGQLRSSSMLSLPGARTWVTRFFRHLDTKYKLAKRKYTTIRRQKLDRQYDFALTLCSLFVTARCPVMSAETDEVATS